MAEEVAIKVDGVSKDFILPHEKIRSIKSAVVGMLRLRRTKDVHHALTDISFQIQKGEFFGIVGRNGSGKSTMLKILAGIYQPTKGSVQTHGKLVPFIELGVGFNPELTGRENVYLNGAMLGFSRKEVSALYDEIVAFAELEKFMDQKLKNYSSGMQVRLAFSMATRSEAEILLVDEVLAVGDADFQRKCFEYFRSLKKNKKTVVFISHDMGAVRDYCDRAVLIDSSRIVKAGTAEKIAQEYTKLFATEAVEQSGNSHKWGIGGVEITSVNAGKRTYSQDDDIIEVQVTVKAKKDFPSGVVPGITIKNDKGEALCGTNNRILGVKDKSMEAGKEYSFTWQVQNIFNDGKIIIEPAMSDGEDMQVCQWWNDALVLRITNSHKTPYPVAPPISLHWGA